MAYRRKGSRSKQHIVALAELCVPALIERYFESAPIHLEAHVRPSEARRVIIMAHPAEYDDRHRRDHKVTVPLLPDTIRHREVHELPPFEGFLAIFRIQAKLSRSRAPH
jgi:hypothetical protein